MKTWKQLSDLAAQFGLHVCHSDRHVNIVDDVIEIFYLNMWSGNRRTRSITLRAATEAALRQLGENRPR